jgi:hypothetical protein
MPGHTCCHASPRKPKAKPSPFRRTTSTAKWILPSAGLLLIPKCPMCLAAYLAVAGIGVSFETADWLRSTLIWSCIASLTIFAALTIRRVFQRRRFAR